MGLFGGTLWGGGTGLGPVPAPSPYPAGTLLAQDYIYLALRRAAHLRPGYRPQMELYNDALLEWRMMFDSLNTERASDYSLPVQQFAVTGPGSQTGGNGYTIGPVNADWPGMRPTSIVRANLVMNSTGGQPVYLPMVSYSAEEWAAMPVLQIPAINVATVFYYDPQWPNGVFNVFPPLNGNSVQIYAWGQLSAPGSLTDQWGGPPGYQNLMVCMLAVRLQPLIGKQVNIHPRSLMDLRGEAYGELEKIKLINRPAPRIGCDFRGGTWHDQGFYDQMIKWASIPY